MTEGKKRYKVARDFTDRHGKTWQAGQEYTGADQGEIQQQVNQGNLKEDSGAGAGA